MTLTHPYSSPAETTSSSPKYFHSIWFWLFLAASCFAAIALPVTFLVGALSAEQWHYNRQADNQQNQIETYLATDSKAFGGLTVEHASNGWAFVTGDVASQQDRDRLESELQRLFGVELACSMIYGVKVDAEL